jgi:twitching motility protein PilT
VALVDSLLTAIVRADGDALVMHVGERPYVVASAGTLDLSTQNLNLDAMTGMLQQLLPVAAQDSLEEFGAVEHRLPPHDKDTFTVVAARGGDDIWIEIRRRRYALEPVLAAPGSAVAPPVAEPQPAPEIAATAPPMIEEPQPLTAPAAPEFEQPLPAVATTVPDAEPVSAVAEAVEVEPARVELPPEVEAVATIVPPTPVEETVTPPVIATFSAVEEVPVTAAPVAAPVAEAAPPVVEDAPHVEERPLVVEQPPALVAPPIAVLVDELPALEEPREPEALPVTEAETVTEAVPAFEDVHDAARAEEPPPQQTETAHAGFADVSTDAPPMAAAPEPDRARVLQMTRTVRIEVPPRATTARGTGVERLLRLAASRAASALFVISDTRPSIRVEGEVRVLDGEAPMTRAEVESAVLEIVPEASQEAVGRGESTEWIADFADLGRVRCITFTDHRGPGVVFRMIATRAATAEQLGLSRELQAMATEPQGLVLVTGRPGSGKSTLVSALVDLVNRQRAEYIITLERQVRLVHENHTAIVSQREIRGGAEEALTAARAALREDPDVLVVDDLASGPMVPLLLQAATEGLVFVSITAPSTIDAVERFVDLASADMRAAVQAAMADTFRGAVAQVLLKKAGGGRVAAREVLLATAAVTRVISDGTSGQLQAALEGGRRHGMVPLFDAVAGLVQSGVVDVREAFRKSPDRGRLLAGLKREGVDTSLVERLA